MGIFSRGGEQCSLKCPKCKQSKNFKVAETWNGNGISFSVNDGIMPEEADDHFQGAPVRVEAQCVECGYLWRVRKIWNFQQLAIDVPNGGIKG